MSNQFEFKDLMVIIEMEKKDELSKLQIIS